MENTTTDTETKTTYTIAYINDTLLVCEPDGSDIDPAFQEECKRADIKLTFEDVTIVKGLTLTDDDEDGKKVWTSDHSCGTVRDKDGVEYRYAVKA